MMISEYIHSYLDFLRVELSPFHVINKIMYDPDVDFKRSTLIRGEFFYNRNLYTNIVKDLLDNDGNMAERWGAIAYSRGPITDHETLGKRSFQVLFNKDYTSFQTDSAMVKYVDLTLNVAIFSNLPESSETVEEYVRVWFDDLKEFDVTLSIISDSIKMYAYRIPETEFSMVDVEGSGSYSFVRFEQKLSFPIFFNIESLDMLKDIYLKMKDNGDNIIQSFSYSHINSGQFI